MTDGRFETYYAPGLGTTYAVRSWIISAILLAIGVPVTWFTFVGNPQWWVLVLVGLVFAFLLFLTVSSAIGAPAKWGSDGRLAVRLDDAGVTLPRVGTLAWDEITAIGITDTGFVHGNIWIRAWEVFTGSSSNRFIRVWVRDARAVLARTGGTASLPDGMPEIDGLDSLTGVWAEGLRSPGWDETVAAIQRAAEHHGVELRGRKN